MRVAILIGTGRPEIEGHGIDWDVTEAGDEFRIEGFPTAMTQAEFQRLVDSGLAQPVPGVGVDGLSDLSASAADEAIFAAAATAGEDSVRARRRMDERDTRAASPGHAKRSAALKWAAVALSVLIGIVAVSAIAFAWFRPEISWLLGAVAEIASGL